LDCELWTVTDVIKYFCLTATLIELCVFKTVSEMKWGLSASVVCDTLHLGLVTALLWLQTHSSHNLKWDRLTQMSNKMLTLSP